MRRLQDNLNSRYIDLANRLRPRAARKKIIAYVESYDDIFFWRSVLQEFETEQYCFQVMLPCRNSLGKGKKAALMNRLGAGLGQFMIACVDSDYDWLMQGHTEVSQLLCNSPYVLHTYAYAIENYQCFAPSLHSVVVMSTLNDREILNTEQFMKEYSLIVWPLFVWNVWAYRYGHHKEFSMSMFADTVGFHDINPRQPEDALEKLRTKVNKCIGWLHHIFPEGKQTYAPFRDELLQMGLKPETTYLYMQGHPLFENVVMPLLTPICNILRREREREISELAVHPTQKQNELSSYQHSQMPVDMMLRKSTGYRESEPYQMLRADIMRLMVEVGRQK